MADNDQPTPAQTAVMQRWLKSYVAPYAQIIGEQLGPDNKPFVSIPEMVKEAALKGEFQGSVFALGCICFPYGSPSLNDPEAPILIDKAKTLHPKLGKFVESLTLVGSSANETFAQRLERQKTGTGFSQTAANSDRYAVAKEAIEVFEKEKLAYEAELKANPKKPQPKPKPTGSNNGKTVVVERGHGGSGHDDKQAAKWEAPDPKKDWLAWLAHQAMQRRAQSGSKPIVNDIIWKKSLGNNKEDAEAGAAETMLQIFPQEEWGDKYKSVPPDEFKKQILALAVEKDICRIAQEGKEYVFRIAAEPENQADVDKLIKQEKLTEDDQYNAAYRLQLYIHGHQFFGHGNQPDTKIKTGFGPAYDLAAGIENVDFDPATNTLRVKLLDTTDAQGAAQAGGTVDITKDKLSASSVDSGSLAVLVASAKAAQWDSYKITAEADDLIQTAIAFILNGLDLDGETQAKVLEAVNAKQPEDQQFKKYEDFFARVKSAPQQSQQPEPAGG